MRAILFCFVALSITVIPGCDSGPTDGGSAKPTLIAGYEYINFAFGFRQEYTLIDDRGCVWQTFPSDTDSLYVMDLQSIYTPADFEKLLAKADSLDVRLTPNELWTINRYANRISSDSILECVNSGGDMGSAETFLFIRRSPQSFRRVMLVQTGDWSCHNHHPAVPMLDSIILKYHMR